MRQSMVLVTNGVHVQHTCVVCPLTYVAEDGPIPTDASITLFYSKESAEHHGWFKDGVDWICPDCAKEIENG